MSAHLGLACVYWRKSHRTRSLDDQTLRTDQMKEERLGLVVAIVDLVDIRQNETDRKRLAAHILNSG